MYTGFVLKDRSDNLLVVECLCFKFTSLNIFLLINKNIVAKYYIYLAIITYIYNFLFLFYFYIKISTCKYYQSFLFFCYKYYLLFSSIFLPIRPGLLFINYSFKPSEDLKEM